MHPSKAWMIGLAAAISAVAAAAATEAGPGSFRLPSAGDRLRPNESSTVSWSIDSGTLAKRDEMELVLSLDGGATFPIRVTARLSPASRSIAWRVPSLATGRAVLALRAGDDEDEESETILAVSEPFTIAADPAVAPETLYPVAYEWRTGDALDGAPARAPSHNLASTEEGPELSPVGGEVHESETPPMGAADATSAEHGSVANAPPRPRPPTPPRLATSLPLPLRL